MHWWTEILIILCICPALINLTNGLIILSWMISPGCRNEVGLLIANASILDSTAIVSFVFIFLYCRDYISPDWILKKVNEPWKVLRIIEVPQPLWMEIQKISNCFFLCSLVSLQHIFWAWYLLTYISNFLFKTCMYHFGLFCVHLMTFNNLWISVAYMKEIHHVFTSFNHMKSPQTYKKSLIVRNIIELHVNRQLYKK